MEPSHYCETILGFEKNRWISKHRKKIDKIKNTDKFMQDLELYRDARKETAMYAPFVRLANATSDAINPKATSVFVVNAPAVVGGSPARRIPDVIVVSKTCASREGRKEWTKAPEGNNRYMWVELRAFIEFKCTRPAVAAPQVKVQSLSSTSRSSYCL